MIPVSSRAIAATVFTNRARIVRSAEAQIPAGSSAIKLGGLPMTLQTESVRVAAKGKVRIISVDVSSDFFVDAPEGSTAQLEQELETLALQLRTLEDQDLAASGRLEMAKSLATAASGEFAKGMAFGRAAVEQIEALRAYVSKEQAEASAEKRALVSVKARVNREIEAVRARLNRVRQPVRQERRAIVVNVETVEAGTMALEASYVVSNAQWCPMYDVRLRGEQVAVTYLAAVSQSTGEDWEGVELSLSTAQPSVSARVPELSPWYLDFMPPPMPVFAGAPAGEMMLRSAMAPMAKRRQRSEAGGGGEMIADEMAQAPPVAEIASATVESSGASVTYKCPRPVTIAGNGSTHRPLIAEFELPARLDHIAVPKIAEEAYLRATVKNTSPYVLLAGPASVFHDDEYVSNTGLKLTARDEEITLQLGVDSRIKVKRELVSRDTSRTFLIGTTRKIEFGYRIEVQNLSDRNASVCVEDQVPHSRHEEIKVKLGSANPKPAEQTDLGILKWKFSLRPQEKSELRFEFQVEHPRHQEIDGLL